MKRTLLSVAALTLTLTATAPGIQAEAKSLTPKSSSDASLVDTTLQQRRLSELDQRTKADSIAAHEAAGKNLFFFKKKKFSHHYYY